MLQIENTYFELANAAALEDKNVLVICDRGSMDASAFISKDQWDKILAHAGLDEVEIRDNRYNQVRSRISRIFFSKFEILVHIDQSLPSPFVLTQRLVPIQVFHMVTAAKGAESFYTVDGHASRSEGIEEARIRDTRYAFCPCKLHKTDQA